MKIQSRIFPTKINDLKANLFHSSEINKTEWDKLVSLSDQGSIFVETGYLDIILPGAWSGIMVYDGEELQACMPILVNRKWGINYALQPIMAKYWGVIIQNKTFMNAYKALSFKKKVINAIIEVIPRNISYFHFNFHPCFDYPLPFFWKSFQLRTAYTYILDPQGLNEPDLFNTYSPELKNSIRTAQKNEIKIIEDASAKALIHTLDQNKKEGKIIYQPVHYQTLNNILNYALENNKGYSFTALDHSGEPVASSIYLQDNNSVYALIHTMAKWASKTDALSLLVHHAIMKASKQNLRFDFLGSMIEPVEAFNRRFCAMPVPYLNISKKNQLLSLITK